MSSFCFILVAFSPISFHFRVFYFVSIEIVYAKSRLYDLLVLQVALPLLWMEALFVELSCSSLGHTHGHLCVPLPKHSSPFLIPFGVMSFSFFSLISFVTRTFLNCPLSFNKCVQSLTCIFRTEVSWITRLFKDKNPSLTCRPGRRGAKTWCHMFS